MGSQSPNLVEINFPRVAMRPKPEEETDMYYCGIDIASQSSSVSIIDQSGHLVCRATVATEADELDKVLQDFDMVQVIIEASPLAEAVAAWIERSGHAPVIIDARAAKNLMASQKKTDARDARTLAEIGRSGWYTPVHRKSAQARQIRSTLRARQTLLKSRESLKSSIRGLLHAHGIRLGAVSDGQFAEHVQALAARHEPGLLPALQAMLDAWQHSADQVKALKKWLETAGRDDQVNRRLQSVEGIGPLISNAFQATIDDPDRFARGEEVADYLGLAPRRYQSGTIDYRGRITKQGDWLLRWHLVEGAHVLLTRGRDCALKRWGLSLAKRKGSAKAKVAVARKLAIVLWKIWKDGTRFTPFPQSA
jgi:transposase